MSLHFISITDIFPLGFKDYSLSGNEIDVTDEDKIYKASTWNKVKGIYMPDGIAVFEKNNIPYLLQPMKAMQENILTLMIKTYC